MSKNYELPLKSVIYMILIDFFCTLLYVVWRIDSKILSLQSYK
jgi:hypothetical protein